MGILKLASLMNCLRIFLKFEERLLCNAYECSICAFIPKSINMCVSDYVKIEKLSKKMKIIKSHLALAMQVAYNPEPVGQTQYQEP